MANPSKQKGTGGETELLNMLGREGLVRTPPGTVWDLDRPGWDPPVRVLATRPDRGQWLFTMDLFDFDRFLAEHDASDDPFLTQVQVEVKRYKAFAHHTIFESKFEGARR